MTTCFHCALPVTRIDRYQVEIDGVSRPVCCPGCKAVAELIRDSGMTNYYAMRDVPQPGVVRPADTIDDWQVYDRDDMLAAYATPVGDAAEATIFVGAMYCAACSWLIESTLTNVAGIEIVEVSPVTHQLRVRFDPDRIRLGGILSNIANLGYKPQPLAHDTASRPELVEQRTALKRLMVASLGMMQVTMFAVALYAGEFQGIDARMQRFLRLVSFVVTTPVVLYSARPFFTAAWRGIVSRAPGMDLPVALAIGSAYVASVYAMMTNGPAVWFDSVTMFVFFLTLGRFLEMRARHRAIDRGTALTSMLPNTATRLDGDARRIVPVSQLVAGDRLLIRPGESIPADGVLVDGETTVDEALLTGETVPQPKAPGDIVSAGSINLDGMIRIRVENTGADTVLGTISRLSERARYSRPAFVQLADRIASYIVVALLVIAAVVATYWHFSAPERAFVITLSVLVVTCPCALALATPAAFAAAGTRLADLRLLVTNGNAIEALARATCVLFDKTGTLTRGVPVIVSTQVFDQSIDAQNCLKIAAALETVSTHPIASAFAVGDDRVVAGDQQLVIGRGVAGTIDGRRWKLGTHDFVVGGDSRSAVDESSTTSVYLGADGRALAVFHLADEIRPDAQNTLQRLRGLGLKNALVSGDRAGPVRRVADALSITSYHFGCSPADKLTIIRTLQDQGETVAMVGDGINDAPVLAGADVSIAPSHGALLAQTSADVIMLGDSLAPVATAVRMARKTMRVVRQNLAWAIVYNATALPLAALGYVPPWAAAIGMSASSLIVVLNALRLTRYD
jgi:Cu2+-exporting ATPase